MIFHYWASIVSFGFLPLTYADEPLTECDHLTSAVNIVECALRMHPDSQRAALEAKRAESLEAAGGQWLNPELGSRGLVGQDLGDNVLTGEVSLTQTFELGGKRGARIERSQAERDEARAQALLLRETVFINTAKAIYRVRQLSEERKVLDEALDTYLRIQRQFQSRPRLSPEQQVSASIFSLATSDYRIKRNSMDAEQKQLENFFELAIGKKWFPKADLLPAFRKVWPKLNAGSLALGGSELKSAEAGLKVAQAELNLAKSQSWPDIKLGPSYEFERRGAISNHLFGANISIPLPIFSLNGGGRAVAHATLAKSEANYTFKRKEMELELQSLFSQYEKISASLLQAVSPAEMEKKHQNIEALFQRGVIPSSLVIEAHRQMYDFTKDLNEHEMEALEALFKIRSHQGKLFEEKI